MHLAAIQAGTVTVEDTGIGMTREAGAFFSRIAADHLQKRWRR